MASIYPHMPWFMSNVANNNPPFTLEVSCLGWKLYAHSTYKPPGAQLPCLKNKEIFLDNPALKHTQASPMFHCKIWMSTPVISVVEKGQQVSCDVLGCCPPQGYLPFNRRLWKISWFFFKLKILICNGEIIDNLSLYKLVCLWKITKHWTGDLQWIAQEILKVSPGQTVSNSSGKLK